MFSSISSDWAALRSVRDRWRGLRQAQNTERTYAYAWRRFTQWCQEYTVSVLPAKPETVELYTVWCLSERRYRSQTVSIHLSAIAAYHRQADLDNPVGTARQILRLARRELRERPQGRRALALDQLIEMSGQLGTGRVIDVRNRAMLVLGFACGWRGSELAALDLADVHLQEREMALWQGRSKTDQEARGRLVLIPQGERRETCPVRVLNDWLELRGAAPGPLFLRVDRFGNIGARGIRRQVIHRVLKQALERIGQDSEGFGSHSLRAGMVTEAAARGASEIAIMQRTGHKSVTTLLGYVRPIKGLRGDPLRGAL